jgi:hypothetical protein
MGTHHLRSDRRGAALVFALLMSIAVAAMALGAIMVASGADLTTRFSAREAAMQASANAGLELIRDSINHGIYDSLLPANSHTIIAENAPVIDAYGVTQPRISRSLYVGRTGGRTGGAGTAGQYGGNFASALSVIRDRRGAVAARRLLLAQESWSKFAVAINHYGAGGPYACTSSIHGPAHSNHNFKLTAGCASPNKTLFTGPLTVVGSIANQSSGNYQFGVTLGVSPITWPSPARVATMQQFAQDADAAGGDYDLTSLTNGSTIPGLRIEFLTIDANGNGSIEWTEGYMRVWQPANTSDSVLAFATGRLWPTVPSPAATSWGNDPNLVSRTCGARVQLTGTGAPAWYSARQIWDAVLALGNAADARDAVRWVLSNGVSGSAGAYITGGITQRRCYLGGDPMLYTATQGTDVTPDEATTNEPAASNQFGRWLARRTGPHASVSTRSDAALLIPLGANPEFKGVVFVTGDVAISGTLRGRVSVYATGNIVLVDDLLYHNAPGTRCDAEGDILGAIGTLNVLVSDNAVQMPFKVAGTVHGGFDDSPADEQFNMFIFAVGTGATGTGNFTAQGPSGNPGPLRPYALGSATGEMCGPAPGGCARVTGGLAMGRMDYNLFNANDWGYRSAHTYDRCGAINPPPYFPTTGRFIESRYYEVDPVWLNDKGIANYFAELRAQ